MAKQCPAGHESDWDDYCSVCGATLSPPPSGASGSDGAAASASAGPSPGAGECENCGAAHRADDVFCESCGFDFASGTLPEGEAATAGGEQAESNTGAATTVVVAADRTWFDQAVAAGELEFPDPIPETVTIVLPGQKALIGRYSQSRGVFPEIDLAAATADPAASSRHAIIERKGDDAWTITDVGSTNGTKVGTELGSAVDLQSGVAVPFGPGTSAWLGAWTRVDFGS